MVVGRPLYFTDEMGQTHAAPNSENYENSNEENSNTQNIFPHLDNEINHWIGMQQMLNDLPNARILFFLKCFLTLLYVGRFECSRQSERQVNPGKG